MLLGEFELDGSYFDGKRKDNRGRWVAFFGVLERAGKVYTAAVQRTQGDTCK